jgi:beta-glucanase (GH16 family)
VDNPYEIEDGYIFVQKEARRNINTDWELVWDDEFDQGTLDTSHWTRLGLFTSPQWKLPVSRWQEHLGCFRYITATDPHVVQFDEDNIFLKGIVNDDTINGDPRPFLTGGIYTWNKFAYQYGRIEVRAKLEPAYGAWPAIWMKSEKEIYKDQHNGEMDIMERLNHDDSAYQTTHNHYTITLKQKNPKKSTIAKIDPDDYNVYSVSWYPDKLIYAINGIKSYEYPKVNGAGTFQWPFDQPFFLFIDQQLEGSWPGKVTQPEELPISMIVDWVRLYQ